MAITNLIPWNRNRALTTRRDEDPFVGLQREVNRMFEDFGRGFGVAPWSGWDPGDYAPRIDLRETDDEVVVSAELPGLDEKDFELSLAAGILSLKGEKRHEHEEKGSVHRVERTYGAFQREVALPCEVLADEAKAVYRNGVLTVTLPKAPEARRQLHRIEVQSR